MAVKLGWAVGVQWEQLRDIWQSQQQGRGAGHTSSTGHRRAQVTRGQARGHAGSRDKEEVAPKDSWRGNGCLIQEELYHQRDTEQLWSHMFTRPAQAAGPAAVPGFWYFDLSSGKHCYKHKAGVEGLTEPKPKASNVLMHSPGQRSNTSVTIQSKLYLIKKKRSQEALAKVPHMSHYKLLQWTAVWHLSPSFHGILCIYLLTQLEIKINFFFFSFKYLLLERK